MKKSKNTPRNWQEKIEKLLGWSAESQTSSEPGSPYLKERNGILSLHFNTNSIQSEMSIDAPDELVIPYTRDMMSFLLLEPQPQRIAMIGLGGGSLAKYCYRHLPETTITVVEISPEVIAMRNEFAIPADDGRFNIVEGDGAAFVTEVNNQFDVLIVDGFDVGGLPMELGSQPFYDNCYAALSDDGIMVANLWIGYPRYDQCLERIRTSFAGRVIVIDAEDGLNRTAIAVKSAAFPPAPATIRHHANSLATHTLNFQAKSNKLIKALSGL